MPFEIIPYTQDMLGDLTAQFNQAVDGMPNSWPVASAEMAGALGAATGADGDGGPQKVEDQVVEVAVEGGAVAGFVHYGTDRRESDEPPRGAICFLQYDRDRRAVGQALLATAEDAFGRRGHMQVSAFRQNYRYRFYGFAHAFLSDHLDHVSALLQFNRYGLSGGEVFLNGLNYATAELPEVDLEFDLSVSWTDGRGKLPGCHVKAMRGDVLLGECVAVSGGEFSRCDDAQEFGFVDWLGVEEDHQHNGLGKLLLYRARNEMLAAGYRHTAISTARNNYRAFLFYSHHGYRVVDWTYELSKSLGG